MKLAAEHIELTTDGTIRKQRTEKGIRMAETRTIRPPGWLEQARQRWVRRAAPVTVIEPVRVGVDIDGVMAPGSGGPYPGTNATAGNGSR